ncbi:MAG: hypothetical protein FJ271_23370 [Planctomycetes bacterium]|nr:hypothetical protein [Planctomycetota bacterium]
MLRTRLMVGTVLVGLVAAMLVADQGLSPWFPFLAVMAIFLGLGAAFELLQLLGPGRRPEAWICYLGILLVILGNWPAHLPQTGDWLPGPGPWPWLMGSFIVAVLAVIIRELASFREPGRSMERMALAVFAIAYLGLLPSCFVQLRWLDEEVREKGTQALALAIFVPKLCDVGAYFTGRFLGRHRMTPVLSPKKTWEGAAGGLAAAVLTTVALDRCLPGSVLTGNLGMEIAFGLSVGVMGMFGDLAESLIKRDCQQKDASQAVPGFGGILDVIDSVIFPAPLVYGWLSWTSGMTR